MASINNLQKIISIRGTKAQCTALSGTLEESSLAYATDTGQIGIYTNGAWAWSSGGSTAAGELLFDDAGNFLTDDSDDGLYEG